MSEAKTAEPAKIDLSMGLTAAPVFGSEKELMEAFSKGEMPKRSFASYIAGVQEATPASAPMMKSALGVMVESTRPTPSKLGGGMKVAQQQMPLPVESAPVPAAPQLETQRPQPDVSQIPAPEERPAPPPITEFSTPAAKAAVKQSLAGVAALLNSMGVKPATTGQPELFNLADNELHPFVLDTLFTGFFGPDWHDWEHDTLTGALGDIEAEGGGVASEQNRTKLLAMQALGSTTYPWVSMQPFAKCALALDNRIPDFGILEPVHPATVLCALQVMRLMNPEGAFSHEVIRFMAVSCVHDGMMIFPDPVMGDKVGEVIQRLTNKSVSAMDYELMMSLWRRFVEAGGAAPDSTDETDESNLVDYQVSSAARIAAYAEEFEARRVRQLGSLSAWIAQAGRS